MAKQIIYQGRGAPRAVEGRQPKLADAVKVTLGPKGRNVVLEKKFGSPTITKDGVTVAKEIEVKDPVENLGTKMVREVASKTSDVAGDGTTTATVLAQAIFREGSKNVAAGANPMGLKRGIDRAVTAVVEELGKLSRTVSRRHDRPGRHDLGEQRQDDREHHRRGDGQGRERRASSPSRKPRRWRPRSRSSRACSSTAVICRPTSSPTLSGWRQSSRILSS